VLGYIYGSRFNFGIILGNTLKLSIFKNGVRLSLGLAYIEE
jgi:hypothetical protein